jgi:hypothetical protein
MVVILILFLVDLFFIHEAGKIHGFIMKTFGNRAFRHFGKIMPLCGNLQVGTPGSFLPLSLTA